MRKNLIIVWIFLGIFSSGIVFWWEVFYFMNNQSIIPRIYNPISWFYEQKKEEEIQKDVTANMDFYSDTSFQKFLDDSHPLSWNYEVKDIVKINSARRSQSFQRQLSKNCSNARCANPWTSEHEAGLALDLGVNGWNIKAWSWKYYQWLIDNAHLYGFHNSYQKWMEIDGKMVEPWHWRYVWTWLATLLHDRWQTFAEYFYENIENKSNF